MTITKISTTVFPQSDLGRRIADELEEKYRKQGCFGGRKETTQSISVVEICTSWINDEVKNGNKD